MKKLHPIIAIISIVQVFIGGLTCIVNEKIGTQISMAGVIGIILFLVIPLIISRFVNNPYFCESMGWHKAPISQGFDGCSMNGKCPACGKEVMQDSQGNWF